MFTGFAYDIGAGIYDITGPVAQVRLVGYGKEEQQSEGIHFRLRARSFVIADGARRVAFVSMDGHSGSDVLVKRVLKLLKESLGSEVYTEENFCLSGTHDHSGPGDFHQYALMQISSWGFSGESFEAMATGITESVLKAHRSARPGGRIFWNQGALMNANINRSPSSYGLNPESERQQYVTQGDTDKTMVLLRFEAADGTPLGMLNWFPVHATSMNSTNRLVSGDNKGYASYLFEKRMNGEASLPGHGSFVAAFASSNLGDVSPNINGARCLDTGLPCEEATSTCGGRSELCVAFGPGTNGDMFESTEMIGRRQYEHAWDLFNSARTEITGPLDYRHAWVNMNRRSVSLENGKSVRTCGATLGYAFAAGTTDGPGEFDFRQGRNSANPMWQFVSNLLANPPKHEIECQAPKRILLDVGDFTTPYLWEPPALPLQIFRIGQLFILGAPAEFTTMSGRRLRGAVQRAVRESQAVQQHDNSEAIVTIAGLANSYGHYVTTPEEYSAQRYEAASTLYGPNTLQAYIQEYVRLTSDLLQGKPSISDDPPQDISRSMISLMPGVFFDTAPWGKNFGNVIEDARGPYQAGLSTVTVRFQSANPRNNLRTQDTFLKVDYFAGGSWVTVATDGDWETKFMWQTTSGSSVDSTSFATIQWAVPLNAKLGTYRVCHFGNNKIPLLGFIREFSGCSSSFQVVRGRRLGTDTMQSPSLQDVVV
jgi:neutral ceramidase